MIRDELFTFLTGNAGISAIISARMSPQSAPQGAAFPNITFFRVSNDHFHNFAGAEGLVQQIFQIDCRDTDQTIVDSLADAVREALDGFLSKLMGAIFVKSIHLLDERDRFEPPSDAGQEGVYVNSMDFRISHDETIPTP